MKLLSGKDSVRNHSFEYMRSIACLAIVLMHMMNVSEILYRSEISKSSDCFSMMIVYLMMWAVPLFVMVTGALILDPSKNISLKNLYGKYILRVFGALVLFTIIFRFVDMLMNGESFSAAVIGSAFYKLFTATSWSHLWYLYLMIGLYVLLPAYRSVTAGLDKKTFLYILAVYAVFLSLLPLSDIFGVSTGFHLQTSAVYVLFFFAGYAVKSGILNIKKSMALILFLLATALIVLFCIMRYELDLAGLDVMLGSYSSPLVVVQSVSLFILMYKNETSEKSGFFSKLITVFDRNSFGIYLIHMIFLRLFLRHMQINPYGTLYMFAVVYFATLVISFGIAFLLHLIPGVRRIV